MSTDRFRTITPGRCWWCGAGANSREHKFKRADVVREFGKGPLRGHGGVVIQTGLRTHRVQGSNSALLKFAATLCQNCNNARSQPFDRAYDRFLDWLSSNEEAVLTERAIDLRAIFGETWADDVKDLGRYYVKHVGCMAAECTPAGSVYLSLDIVDYLEGSSRWPASLAAEFYIDQSSLLIVDIQEIANDGPRLYFSVSEVGATVDAPTGQLIAPQARLTWRGFGFAWQLNGLDPRPDPFGEQRLSLSVIATYPPEVDRAARETIERNDQRGIVARRRAQGLM